ncbi:MAG: LuxR C-terminal-related transcriptional regulator [Archangium sp.]
MRRRSPRCDSHRGAGQLEACRLKEIADKLGITEETAKDHVKASFKKLKVSSGRTGLIALARRS